MSAHIWTIESVVWWRTERERERARDRAKNSLNLIINQCDEIVSCRSSFMRKLSADPSRGAMKRKMISFFLQTFFFFSSFSFHNLWSDNFFTSLLLFPLRRLSWYLCALIYFIARHRALVRLGEIRHSVFFRSIVACSLVEFQKVVVALFRCDIIHYVFISVVVERETTPSAGAPEFQVSTVSKRREK